jgi:hypothetical protein
VTTVALERPALYATETEAAHFAWWCEQNLQHSVDRWAGQPVLWEDWQRRFLDELLAFECKSDAPYWRSIALVVPRKNGKTQMLAALAIYRLLEDDGKPEILLAAADDKQAGKLFDACIDYLRRNPDLDARVHRREHVGQIVNVETGGRIIRLTSTGSNLDGYNPSLVIVDELHGFTTPRLRRVWTALRTARGAREKMQIVTITTAGDAASRASSILGRMIDGNESNGEVERPHAGLTISRNHDSRLLVYNYSAPTTDPTDYPAMMLANPASWITEGFIAEQALADDLTDSDVLQLHGCVWAETETTFVPPSALEVAVRSGTSVKRGEPVVLSFDGSERRDETWLGVTTADGRVMPLKRWQKPKGDDEWRVPRPEVHRAVADAFETYDVLEFSFDPPGWYSEGDEWASLYGDRVVMFDTNKASRMAPACERMRAGILSGEVSFCGPLARELAAHFGNCVARETGSGTMVSKDHPDSPRKIDGAVMSIIGYDRATWHANNPAADSWSAV